MIYAITERVGGGPEDYCLQLKAALGDETGSLIRLGQSAPVSGECVFLQYSGYEYAKRGAPLWLLEMIRRNRPRIGTLGINFHELYALGPPWSSAFWLSPVQRYIASELVKLCDFWITNTSESGVWLAKYSGHKPHAVIPTFSNVGESSSTVGPRVNQLVVFGTASRRAAAYRLAGSRVFEFAKRQELRIVDIGDPFEDSDLKVLLREAAVVQLGRLDAASVSAILTISKYGLVAHRTGVLAKSGVFAAYAAHGVCPIVVSKRIQSADGLVPGDAYVLNFADTRVEDKRANVAMKAHDWYQSHRISVYASIFKGLVEEGLRNR